MMMNKLRKNLAAILETQRLTYHSGNTRCSIWEVDVDINGITCYIKMEIHAYNGKIKAYKFI